MIFYLVFYCKLLNMFFFESYIMMFIFGCMGFGKIMWVWKLMKYIWEMFEGLSFDIILYCYGIY